MENFLYTRDALELDERDIETNLYTRGILAPRRGIGGLGKALGKAFGKALHKGNGKGKGRKIINNMLSSNSNNGGNGQDNLNRRDVLDLDERDLWTDLYARDGLELDERGFKPQFANPFPRLFHPRPKPRQQQQCCPCPIRL